MNPCSTHLSCLLFKVGFVQRRYFMSSKGSISSGIPKRFWENRLRVHLNLKKKPSKYRCKYKKTIKTKNNNNNTQINMQINKTQIRTKTGIIIEINLKVKGLLFCFCQYNLIYWQDLGNKMCVQIKLNPNVKWNKFNQM